MLRRITNLVMSESARYHEIGSPKATLRLLPMPRYPNRHEGSVSRKERCASLTL